MKRLRQVRLQVNASRYTLTVFDTHSCDSLGKPRLAYTLKQNGRVLFEGSDFCCSPLHGIDSDECMKALLGFLTLKPSDTDSEYFEHYTADQMAFARGDAENLEMAVYSRFGFDD